MRRERTLLQHEVDILNQKLSQELLILKDDLKGMFDDRKMSVRMEQRTMESKVRSVFHCVQRFSKMLTWPMTDPRTQLQNNRPPQQRQQIGNRRPPLGPDPPLRHGHPLHGIHGSHFVEIREL